jgi:predicted Zn-dependent protease
MELAWGTPKQLEAAFKADVERRASLKLKQAQRLISQNNKKQAVQVLEDLVENMPDTRAAKDGGSILAKLKQ